MTVVTTIKVAVGLAPSTVGVAIFAAGAFAAGTLGADQRGTKVGAVRVQ